MKIKSYPNFELILDNRQILYAEFTRHIRVDIQKAMEMVWCRLEFTGNSKHYMIADLSKVTEVTGEAKEYLQNPDGGLKNLMAAALIASNPVSALIANIFIKTPKSFPARYFSKKEEALAWILDQKQRSVSPVNLTSN